jgi:hypothetical protein
VDVNPAHLRASLCFNEPIPLFELACSLELARLLALLVLDLALSVLDLALSVPDLALSDLELALLLTGLRNPPLILHLLGARLPGTVLVDFPPLNVGGAVSGVAVALTGLNLRRDLAALILAVVMIVLPVLRLRRCGNDKERRGCREYLSVLHRSSIRSMYYITRYPQPRDVLPVLTPKMPRGS